MRTEHGGRVRDRVIDKPSDFREHEITANEGEKTIMARTRAELLADLEQVRSQIRETIERLTADYEHASRLVETLLADDREPAAR
jgi:hypothetical protein